MIDRSFLFHFFGKVARGIESFLTGFAKTPLFSSQNRKYLSPSLRREKDRNSPPYLFYSFGAGSNADF